MFSEGKHIRNKLKIMIALGYRIQRLIYRGQEYP